MLPSLLGPMLEKLGYKIIFLNSSNINDLLLNEIHSVWYIVGTKYLPIFFFPFPPTFHLMFEVLLIIFNIF